MLVSPSSIASHVIEAMTGTCSVGPIDELSSLMTPLGDLIR